MDIKKKRKKNNQSWLEARKSYLPLKRFFVIRISFCSNELLFYPIKSRNLTCHSSTSHRVRSSDYASWGTWRKEQRNIMLPSKLTSYLEDGRKVSKWNRTNYPYLEKVEPSTGFPQIPAEIRTRIVFPSSTK